MPLPNPKITVNTGGYPKAEFTFAILGPYDEEEEEYASRIQVGNPVFTKDWQNNDFVADQEYLTTAYHPDYCDPAQTFRLKFTPEGDAVPVDELDLPITPLFPAGDLAAEIRKLLPFLGYSLGGAVTIEVMNTFNPDEFDGDEFDFGNG